MTHRVASIETDLISATPLTPHMGAVVDGVDLSSPMSDGVFARVREEFLRHLLLVFRGQQLKPEDLIDFSDRFGDLDVHPRNIPTSGHAEIRVLSNVGDDGELLPADEGPQNWHSELSYTPTPSSASVLYCVEIPEVGGGTEFANMHAAFEAMPEAMRRDLAGKFAVHDRNWRSSGAIRTGRRRHPTRLPGCRRRNSRSSAPIRKPDARLSISTTMSFPISSVKAKKRAAQSFKRSRPLRPVLRSSIAMTGMLATSFCGTTVASCTAASPTRVVIAESCFAPWFLVIDLTSPARQMTDTEKGRVRHRGRTGHSRRPGPTAMDWLSGRDGC